MNLTNRPARMLFSAGFFAPADHQSKTCQQPARALPILRPLPSRNFTLLCLSNKYNWFVSANQIFHQASTLAAERKCSLSAESRIFDVSDKQFAIEQREMALRPCSRIIFIAIQGRRLKIAALSLSRTDNDIPPANA